ncbi:MAG: endolytic transglycosylase MltG [Nitrospinae bacterium]|nr:endolytic transglycosylase MltG [Nitrospinota bacterium]MBF0633966.1 endolytic transglycosylase MltG [Nitrospinota bacterium]
MRFAIVFFIAVGLAAFAFSTYEDMVTRPNAGAGVALVEIKKGDSVKAMAARLAGAGVIGNRALFEIEARLSGAGGRLRAGEYTLEKNASIRSVIKTLVEGKTAMHKITIPEGLTARQIAETLEKNGILPANEFMASAADPALLDEFGLTEKSAEGYLFPETYNLTKGTKGREAVSAMLKMFFAKAGKALPPDLMADPKRLHELVTLASIVEKETGAESEKKLIAAVFANRLKKRMPLQSDPTVIYALPDFDGNIRKKDLSYDSPYNTYTRKGLPPGPIANPGLTSLLAALEPADADYLYFVSKNNGEHYFSSTLDEHNKAVRKYQIVALRSRVR